HTSLSMPDPPTPALYTLSLHDALPIWQYPVPGEHDQRGADQRLVRDRVRDLAERGDQAVAAGDPAVHEVGAAGHQEYQAGRDPRSEEHTSELQSRENLVCRLLLEKKKR